MKPNLLILLILFFCIGAVDTDLWRVTAFCPAECCCGKDADGVTACGHTIREGDRFVAAPSNIPFYTKIIVPGYANNEIVEVLDRGGAITEGRLDVFFPTHQEAKNWGVKWLKVRFVK